MDAIKNRVLNPDFVSVVVAKVNAIIRERVSEYRDEREKLIAERNKLSGEISNLVNYVATIGSAPQSIQFGIEKGESELLEIDTHISKADSKASAEELSVDPKEISEWLTKLDELILKNVPVAREAIAGIIGDLVGTPVSKEGKPGLEFTGKPKIGDVLGVAGNTSTLIGSGGALFDKVGVIMPAIGCFVVAA